MGTKSLKNEVEAEGKSILSCIFFNIHTISSHIFVKVSTFFHTLIIILIIHSGVSHIACGYSVFSEVVHQYI